MNNTALITGAAGGIGFEFAKIAAKNGYNLLLIDVNSSALNSKKEELQLTFPSTLIDLFVCDLAERGIAQKIYDHISDSGLTIEILFNNAGFGNFGHFVETDWNKDEAMLNVHIVTSSHLIKLLLPGMIFRKKGYVLNNASVAAFVPGPLMSTYHASKSYLLLFTQALANELKDTGVHASVLCPGMTKTGFAKANGNDDPSIKFNIASPEDVALFAFESVMKGRIVAVPGIWNKLSAFLPRLLSRNKVANMVGNIQRKNHAKRTDQKQVASTMQRSA
ncbi:MAG: short-chain dehydrogenase [Cytophagales bacterium CG12_big_fil_rev_8_21_14_0_65_40_12]|nr:MAG: short-chain dehydrogenase [Cytophagales bacterium CG12_big_fil_rev_8_21_14_0_65_40_12]PIW05044.1 MAG: short-chain dehydrogenase [Cytophagales bacterium CG17_big_fil_post_rev_8_21_14_2_50_40_13]